MIVRVDRYHKILRLFKYISIKAGGSSMTKIGARIAAVAAFMVTLAACGGSAAPAAHTDVAVTSNSILLGNTIAQSRPAASYGTVATPELAYFTYINNTQAGVNGP